MPDFKTLQLEFSPNGVATLWLNRPDKNNAFNAEMIRELLLAFDEIEAHPQLRFLLLRGRGKHFSAGADLAWMQESAKLDYNANLNDARELAQVEVVTECLGIHQRPENIRNGSLCIMYTNPAEVTGVGPPPLDLPARRRSRSGRNPA